MQFSEFTKIIKPNLSAEFTIYYDDLDLRLEDTFFDIFENLKISNKVYATTFYIYGWMGLMKKFIKMELVQTI